ncbi:Ig-like domain-containing protein [Sediminibacterium goheungense]|uniref:Gliding motility-associated-like protein n=1 Tax=Sediminibacterium goheungense TaxID=1086393 RepID=A0A4R6INU1_9BACT|nr:Ig-like domain-containing protein [Sediminibacterium goheungense]TDO23585.1 gliding motility-associated-like protein [Sediminibacterium goheungense]
MFARIRIAFFLMAVILIAVTNATAQNTTFKKGSAIIDVGSATPTIGNSLKPYGLIYALLKNHNVPVNCVIDPNKVKDGIDFTYSGKSYRGGPFIISVDYLTTQVKNTINSFVNQGAIVDYTTSDLTVNVTYKLNFAPKWVMDRTNGVIAVRFLNNAGIPSSAFSFKEPSQLGDCDDLFVMPHADPTWAYHNKLYFWNKENRGAIWAGCHAVSVLENLSKDTSISGVPTTLKMNFLSTNGLVNFEEHGKGALPYSPYNPADPLAQYIGKTDGAQTFGSENVFLPKLGGGWNSGTKILTGSPQQSDVPLLSPGPGAVNIYGKGFNDNARGYVAYQAGHNIASTLTADAVAAQRIFFNFSFFALNDNVIPKISASISGIPTQMNANTTYTNFTANVTGLGGPFTYEWVSTIPGTFTAANGAVTSFTPSNSITTLTTGIVTCKVTDACGRVSFDSKGITVVPANPPITASNIAKSILSECTSSSIVFNVFDSNVDANAGARTLVSVTGLTNGTVLTNTTGEITYVPAAYFKGTDAGTYTISNGISNVTGNLNITVGEVALIPSLTNDAATAKIDNPTAINVLGNDKNTPSSSDGGNLYIRDIVTKPGKGYVYINTNGTLTYLSKKDETNITGGDSFSYLACNNSGYCAVGLVNITLEQDACTTGQYQAANTTTSTTTFTAVSDTYINSQNSPIDSSNHVSVGGLSVLRLHGNSTSTIGVRKPLMKFDLSTIATNATVNSATLKLYVTSGTSFLNATLSPIQATIFALTKDWVENEATWNNYKTGSAWSAGGAGTDDYSSLVTNPSLPGTAPTYTLTLAAQSEMNASIGSLVSSWVSTPANNKGLIIVPKTSIGAIGGGIHFFSREASTASLRPQLEVNYSTPAPCLVIPGNYKPIAYPDTTSTPSGTAKTISVLANDANYYGNTNVIQSVTTPQYGTASIVGNTILYTPNGSYVGTDTLTYTIKDNSTNETTTTTVRINVTRIAPKINHDAASTNSGTAVTIAVGANDTDAQGQMGAPTVTTNPKNGTFTINGNSIVYTPGAGFYGKDSLIYSRSNISSDPCVPVLSDTAIVRITVNNQPPVAGNDIVTTFGCTPVDINAKTNDSDPEGTPLTINIVSQPTNGTVTINGNGTIRYTPNNGFTGSDGFTYKVKDGSPDSLQSNTASVSVTVSAAANPNQAPVGVADSDNTLINQPVNTDVLANDSDPNSDPLTVSITAPGLLAPTNGTLVLLGNKQIRYIPNANFTGTDTYEYQLTDNHPSCSGSSSLSVKVLVTIKVTPIPITVAGTVWDDANGSGTGTFSNIFTSGEVGTNGNGGIYLYLVDNNNEIIDQTSIDNSGNYLLVNVPPSSNNLKLIMSNEVKSIGETLTTSTLPAGYVVTSPGIRNLTTGTSNLTGIDFGVGILPVAISYDFTKQVNPGALLALDATKFTGTDVDGTIVSIRYTSFPSNIASVVIGGTTYTSGNWPGGGVTVALNTTISIFPNAGTVTPEIQFQVIDNSGKESLTAATVKVPMYTPLLPGSINGPGAVCGVSVPGALTSLTAASGGQSAISYQWQSSLDNTTFTNITDATFADYTPGNTIAATTYFRRRAITNDDAAVFSNVVTVTFNALPSVPVSGTGATSAVSGTFNISATAPAGANLTLDWYATLTGGSVLTGGSGTTTFTTPTVTYTTTYFVATRNTVTGCVSSSRLSVVVTITGSTNPGIIGSNQTICGSGTPAQLTSIQAPDAGAIQWQSSTSTDPLTFTNIGGANSATYTPTTITTTTYYRRLVAGNASNIVEVTVNPLPAQPTITAGARTGTGTVTLSAAVPAGVTVDWYSAASGGTLLSSGSVNYTTPSISSTTNYFALARNISTGCVASARTPVTATINPTLTGGTIGSNNSYCGPSTPAAFTSTAAASGGTGSISYQWESSTDNTTFTNIGGATNATYTPGTNIAQTTYYRRKASTSVDAAVYSNTVVITIKALPIIVIAPLTAAITTGSSIGITASGAVTYSWSPTIGLSAANTATVTASPTTTRLYTVSGTDADACVGTASITVTVNPALNPGSIGSDQVICANTAPAALTSVAAASGGTGTISYQWQSSTNNILFTNIVGAIAATYAPSALSQTTYYRRLATTSVDVTVMSNVVTITANPLPVLTITPASLTLPKGAYAVLTASGATTYTWTPTTNLGSTNTASVTANPSATTTYTVSGIGANTCTNTLSVTITVDDVKHPDFGVTNVNVPLPGNVSTNDNTQAGTTYGTPIPVTGNPSGGTVTMNANGTYSFTSPNVGIYRYYVPVCASGQTTGCPVTLLQITVFSHISTTNPPVANPDIATTKMNTPVTVNILSNDKCANTGCTLNPASVSITTNPVNGTTTVNPDGTIIYTPNNGFTGRDSLQYSVCDNTTPVALCAVTKVYFNVLPTVVSAKITAADDYGSTTLGGTITGNILSNDKHSENSAITVTSNGTPLSSQGTLVMNANGSYTFTAAANFTGPVDIVYTVCGGTPNICTNATLHLLVSPLGIDAVNDDFTSKPIDGAKGGSTTTVLTNDKLNNNAVNANDINITIVNNGGITGLTVSSSGILTVPSNTTEGNYTVIYQICEKAQPVNCDQATVLITIARGLYSEVTAVCIGDVPYVQYKVTPNFLAGANPVTLTWLNTDKSVVTAQAVQANQSTTATILWPGAVVDANSKPVDWPGWIIQNGVWVQGNDGFEKTRPTAYLVFSVNPTDTVQLSYPPASPACVASPDKYELLAGSIGTNHTICAGAPANTLTSITNASGGIGTISYQWQISTDGTNFTNITNTNAATLAPGTLTQDRFYRRIASTSNGITAISNVVKVTVTPVPAIVGPIIGDCAVNKDSTRLYTVTPAANATSYLWTVPVGWTGNSTTNSITVGTGNSNGVITVTPKNGNCTGSTVSFTVKVIDYAQVTFSATPTTALGDNNTPINVGIQLIDVNGLPITCSGGPATLCTNSGTGTFTTVIDNGNGTYSSTLTSPANNIDICGSVGGVKIQKTVKVNFTGPQGAIKGNGPIFSHETPTLTFTATEGVAPFTVIYRAGNSQKTDTLKNIQSGQVIPVPNIQQTTFYTMLSIIASDGARRDNNFTRDTTTIIVLAPRIVVTLKADPPKLIRDSIYSTKLNIKVKNIGDVDLKQVELRANLEEIFPRPVEFFLDSVKVSGATVRQNPNYNGRSNTDLFAYYKPKQTLPGEIWSAGMINWHQPNTYNVSSIGLMSDAQINQLAEQIQQKLEQRISYQLRTESADETATENELEYYTVRNEEGYNMFAAISELPVNVEGNVQIFLRIKPNGYFEPFIAQVTTVGTGFTQFGTAKANSVSNDNQDETQHPEITKKGTPVPSVITVFPNPSIGLALKAGPLIAQGDGSYNVKLSYVVTNYGDVNLQNVTLLHNLLSNIGSPATFTIVTPPSTTGTIAANPAFNGKTDINLLVSANSILGVGATATVEVTVNIKPNQPNAIYKLQATVTGFSLEVNGTVSDLSNDGVNPDTDGDKKPSEKLITTIAINVNIPPLVTPPVGTPKDITEAVLVTDTTFCNTVSNLKLIPRGAVTGGYYPYEYQWQQSANNVNFTDITGATDTFYVTGTLTSTTWYRRRVISGSLEVFSNSIKVTINKADKPAFSPTGTKVIPFNGSLTVTASTAKTYAWSTGGTSNAITVVNAGKYWLNITDNNNCAAVDTVLIMPPPPLVKDSVYIFGTPGLPGTPTLQTEKSANNNIVWYADSTTTNGTVAPVFPTTPGVYTYWVTQKDPVWGLESIRVKFTVTIKPPVPVTRNAIYIIGAPGNPPNSGVQAQATGGGTLRFYTSPTGGTNVAAPVLPGVIGVYTYYVSQIINGVESDRIPYTVTMLAPTQVTDIEKVLTKPVQLQEDGSFLFGFTFYTKNLRPELLDSVRLSDDLTTVFPNTTSFNVVSIKASGNLIANSLYDGRAQIELLANGSQLPGLKTDSVEIMVRMVPNGFSGTLNNTARINAISPFGRVGVVSTDPFGTGTGRIPTKFSIPLVDIFIPTGFSPNRDGVNDNFVITRPFNTNISLEIFNRWGNRVYRDDNYQNNWGGRGNQPNRILGDELPDGTYYYIVLATDKGTGAVRKFAGYLTLKR